MTAYSALWLRGARRLRHGHGALVREGPRAPQRTGSGGEEHHILHVTHSKFSRRLSGFRHIHTNIFPEKHGIIIQWCFSTKADLPDDCVCHYIVINITTLVVHDWRSTYFMMKTALALSFLR